MSRPGNARSLGTNSRQPHLPELAPNGQWVPVSPRVPGAEALTNVSHTFYLTASIAGRDQVAEDAFAWDDRVEAVSVQRFHGEQGRRREPDSRTGGATNWVIFPC